MLDTKEVPSISLESFPEILDLDIIQADIDNGKQCSQNECAIALAAKRRFDGVEIVRVRSTLQIFPDQFHIVGYTPMDTLHSETTRDFDTGKNISPRTIRYRRSI